MEDQHAYNNNIEIDTLLVHFIIRFNGFILHCFTVIYVRSFSYFLLTNETLLKAINHIMNAIKMLMVMVERTVDAVDEDIYTHVAMRGGEILHNHRISILVYLKHIQMRHTDIHRNEVSRDERNNS